MIAEMEIKGKSPLGYEVTYRVWDVVNSCETEKEFVDKCTSALKDCFRISGLSKRNKSD